MANFDFNIDGLLGMIIKFNEEDIEKFPQSFETIGYGNNSILNMGSIFVVNMFQDILFVVFVALYLFGLTNEFNSTHVYIKL